MSTRSRNINVFGSRARPVRKADNLTAVCEPIVESYRLSRPVTRLALPFLRRSLAVTLMEYFCYTNLCSWTEQRGVCLVIDCDRPSNSPGPLSECKMNTATDCWNKEISSRFVFEQKEMHLFGAVLDRRGRSPNPLTALTRSK
jgi:hypothetical protein